MNLFMALRVAMVSYIYTYPETHGVAYVKYVQLSTTQ